MPDREIIKRIKARLQRKADYAFFFENLKSVSWALPLAQEGFFKNPPPGEKSGDSIRFAPWPESRFLARVASESPETVIRIALQIPETENPRVIEDLVAIALQSPPRLAKALIPAIIKSLQSPYSWGGYQNFAGLVSYLAKGGEEKSALKMANVLLEFLPDPEEAEKRAKYRKDNTNLFLRPEARPRFDAYTYHEIVEQILPDLASVAPVETIGMACTILDQAISWTQFDPATKSRWDGSFYWQSSLEAESRRADHNPKAALSSGIISIVESTIKRESSLYPKIESILDSHKWQIFERILIKICRQYPEAARNRIVKFILDTGNDPVDFTYEFVVFLKGTFKFLSPEEQRQFIKGAFSGPDTERFKENRRSWGNEVTEAETNEFIRTWKIRRLYPVKEFLSTEERANYDQLVAAQKEPTPACYAHYEREGRTSFAWGPHSPKSSEELGAEEPKKVIDFLQSWESVKGFNEPSPEGLARAFQKAVQSQAAKFSAIAASFEKIEPTYIRGLLSGLETGVKNNEAIDWAPVLKLCEWVVAQPVEIEGRSRNEWDWKDGDPDWRGARQSIATLIQAGSYSGKGEIPFAFREKVFAILQPLTEDSNPTREYELENKSWQSQPATLAINSVRGDAMHALMSHAMWVHRHLKQTTSSHCDLKAMPEIAGILERRLDLQVEKTYAIRSVYGQFLPYLHYIDSDWTAHHLRLIFPSEKALKPYRDAAWWTYITFCRPDRDMFRMLKHEYNNAVTCLPEDKGKEHDVGHPDEGLGGHLITFYWFGEIGIENNDDLLVRFYKAANEEIRTNVMVYIANTLESHGGPLPDDIKTHLVRFWDWRLKEASLDSHKKSYDKELLAFTWWLDSKKFDIEWELQQVVQLLRVCKHVETEILILRFLAETASAFPVISAECLLLIVEKLTVKKTYMLDRVEVRTILKGVSETKEPTALKLVRTIQDSLLARGHFDFQKLD